MGNAQQYIGKRVEVGRYEVEVVKYLGEGGSSFIFQVKDAVSTTRAPMVLKRLLAESDTAYEWIQSEIQMHQRFKHPNMVEFIASQTNKKGRGEREVFILMEFCPNGHLYENMIKMGERRFTEIEILKTFRTLCTPVAVLHHEEPPVAHRDIKLENFLLAKNGVYKLCDFGSCVIGTQSLKTKEDRLKQAELVLKRTTAMYRSPELADVEGTAMFGSGELTEAVDIWALGCVLYTMAYFKSPFPPEGLRTERYTIPATPKYSKDLQTLIARMLTADVEKRATIDHVIECLEEMLNNRPLPPLGKSAPQAAKKAAPVKDKPSGSSGNTGESSRNSSFGTGSGKTVEARKETVTSSKPAMDLLDMDFNPTISSSSSSAPVKTASGSGASMGWTTSTPADGFADFANFPSPSNFGSSSTAASSGTKSDGFGFPCSPIKQPAPAQPVMMAPPQSSMMAPPPAAAADPFAALSAPAPTMGYGQQQQFGHQVGGGFGHPQGGFGGQPQGGFGHMHMPQQQQPGMFFPPQQQQFPQQHNQQWGANQQFNRPF